LGAWSAPGPRQPSERFIKSVGGVLVDALEQMAIQTVLGRGEPLIAEVLAAQERIEGACMELWILGERSRIAD
jgi:hypothetical protein